MQSYCHTKERTHDGYLAWVCRGMGKEKICVLKKGKYAYVYVDNYWVSTLIEEKFNLKTDFSLMKAYLMGRLRSHKIIKQ